MTSIDAEAAATRVSVCHMEGNGSYHLIEVSKMAVPAHRRHGDALPGEPVPDAEGFVFGSDCGLEEPTPVVAPGFSGLTEEGSLRLRQENSGGEIYLGVSDLGVGENRVEANRTWPDGTYLVSFSYDGSGTISSSVDGDNNLEYAKLPDCNGGNWDVMDILVVDRSIGTGIAFENVDLNGYALGNFGSFDVSGTSGFQNWTISAFDFTQPWTITGDLVIENFVGSAEQQRLQLTVGCF
jgi:hypothetical protein